LTNIFIKPFINFTKPLPSSQLAHCPASNREKPMLGIVGFLLVWVCERRNAGYGISCGPEDHPVTRLRKISAEGAVKTEKSIELHPSLSEYYLWFPYQPFFSYVF